MLNSGTNLAFNVAIVNENDHQNRLRIEKLPLWTKIEAFGDQLFTN